MGMAQVLTPSRELVTTVGYDSDGELVTLWATAWTLRGELVDQTPWTPHPAQAITEGIERDRGYSAVLVRTAA